MVFSRSVYALPSLQGLHVLQKWLHCMNCLPCMNCMDCLSCKDCLFSIAAAQSDHSDQTNYAGGIAMPVLHGLSALHELPALHGLIALHGLHALHKLRVLHGLPSLQKTIGAKPKLYSKAIELVCGGSPVGCVLVERKAQPRGKILLMALGMTGNG